MPLVTTTATTPLREALIAASGLDSDLNPILDSNENAVPPPGSNQFMVDFADAYNGYALGGVIAGAIHGAEDKSILNIEVVGDSEGDNLTLATALANYWATVLVEPGDASHGGVEVTGVENNAAAFVGDFETAIRGSRTQSPVEPPFTTLIEAVAGVVNQITWTITEVDADGEVIIETESIA